MLTMDKVHDIRDRYFRKGEKISQISKVLNFDEKTVRKYIDMTDFNEPPPKPPKPQDVCPKLDPYKSKIIEWLENDKTAPRKQRHTALKVFNRLANEVEGFDCSYRTVATYYAFIRPQIFAQEKLGYLPLEHKPGEIQVDFGQADFYENGTLKTGKYLEVSFPYSNKGYLQLFYGENTECLFEGLDAIFRHIGAVPPEAWFDNTKVIVTKIIKGGNRTVTERFNRFQEHYRFRSVFTNPGKGHEKGNVEVKVGYHRRNFLVPIPRFVSLPDFNKMLLQLCEEDAQRQHYRYNETIGERFAEDLKACHPLPDIEFDLSGKKTIKTNGWGKFYLNKGMHEYSVSPKYANTAVHLKLTSSSVTVLDENYREIVTHPRLYGDKKQQSMDWIPYLRQLSFRPRAMKYSGIYDILPPTMKNFLDSCDGTETGKVLKVLAELTERTGFESALATVNQALFYGANNADSLQNLYRRLYADVPELPPMPLDPGIPKLAQMSVNLSGYDAFLDKGGVNKCIKKK